MHFCLSESSERRSLSRTSTASGASARNQRLEFETDWQREFCLQAKCQTSRPHDEYWRSSGRTVDVLQRLVDAPTQSSKCSRNIAGRRACATRDQAETVMLHNVFR